MSKETRLQLKLAIVGYFVGLAILSTIGSILILN